MKAVNESIKWKVMMEITSMRIWVRIKLWAKTIPHLRISDIDCWYSLVKLSSYESVLICIKALSYELEWDYMDIEAFLYSQLAKSILWTVIGCWPSEWVYQCISASLLQSCYGLSIKLQLILFFVCQLDTIWGCWAGKCCYYQMIKKWFKNTCLNNQ